MHGTGLAGGQGQGRSKSPEAPYNKNNNLAKTAFLLFLILEKLPSRPMSISREDQDVSTVKHTQDYVQFILEAKKRGRLSHPIE